MQRNLSDLERREYDLVVVGGGIFGVCAALDATQRGLSVAIIDKGDFCSSTSANSFKLVHGGIRYLQHGDLFRVRQSSAARRTFLRVAPHLVQPLPIVVPTYGYAMKSRWMMRVAMGIYDVVTPDRNSGVADSSRHVPPGRCLSKGEVVARYPGLEREGLTGAAVFCDGQMYNPPRLVFAFLSTATDLGASAANYVEAMRFICRNGEVCGVEARDVLTGGEVTIRAKRVLNAAGPYAEPLLNRSFGWSLNPPTRWSRDAYFIVDKPLVEGRAALALQARTKDPDARLSRGARHLFLTPWRGHTLVGVWHKVYDGHPDEYEFGEEELSLFVSEINQAYRGANLTLDDVSMQVAGLIPFGENDPESEHLSFGHRSRFIDHGTEHSVQGLYTLVGVRFTTGPYEATRAVDLIARGLKNSIRSSQLDQAPVTGGDFEDFAALVEQVERTAPVSLDRKTAEALVHNYGSAYPHVTNLIRGDSSLGDRVGSSTVLLAEVVHAARREMAQTLADVVLRRTDLGTGSFPGQEALRRCAEYMAIELDWNANRTEREIHDVVDSFPSLLRRRKASLESQSI